MENGIIIWKTGTPTIFGEYILLNKYYRVEIDYYDTDKGKWLRHNEEDILAWCSLVEIEVLKK
jgi:hypothetical protein